MPNFLVPATGEAMPAAKQTINPTRRSILSRLPVAIFNREDYEDGGDNEPSLGAPEGGSQIAWFRGEDSDREAAHV